MGELKNDCGIIKWKIGWGFSSKCNMFCEFCYSKKTRALNPKSISLDHCLNFIYTNFDKIESINWGTGENALDSEWFTLVSKIHEIAPQIIQGVTTNGYLGYLCLKDASCMSIFTDCLMDVDVSLDFASQKSHNLFRGNLNAFQWVMDTLTLCKEKKKSCSIVILGCDQTLNSENINGVFNIARNFKCNVRINLLRPVRGCSLPAPRYQNVRVALQQIVSNYGTISLADPLFASLFGQISNDPSGVSSLRILPNGSITPSTYLIENEWITANLSDSNVVHLENLANFEPFIRISDKSIPVGCVKCVLADKCKGGCKDRRIIWFNSIKESDPYCPRRYSEEINWYDSYPIVKIKTNDPLIHDGYLPTLIFSPFKK